MPERLENAVKNAYHSNRWLDTDLKAGQREFEIVFKNQVVYQQRSVMTPKSHTHCGFAQMRPMPLGMPGALFGQDHTYCTAADSSLRASAGPFRTMPAK